ncbi:hypothetical protein MKY88_24025 [Lysinibacillus sp. FSL R7-0073]|uniref:hypothetical protein n=1 Tax=Lysinibacillus TaxID=400634 RepID=UPI002E1E8672|nr:hypothetical protein [Lysinibacillus fusiformis]
MSTVIVNGFVTTEGKVVVTNRIDTDQNGKQFIVTEGVYKTDIYIEEIESIETKYFALHEVFVVEEKFSSESNEICYKFFARELERLEC